MGSFGFFAWNSQRVELCEIWLCTSVFMFCQKTMSRTFQRQASIHPCHTAVIIYCPGRPKELCFTTLSLAMETMRMRLSVVKQSFFGPPGQYGRLVTRANAMMACMYT